MSDRRIFPLAAAIVLVFACKMPQPGASPNPQSPDSPTAAFPGLQNTYTPTTAPELPTVTPTSTPHRITLAAPTEGATITLDFATVDDFFERCPTSAEIKSLLADIPIAFEADPTAGTPACKASEGSLDLSPLQKRVYQSVLIMKYLTFDSPLPWTDKSLYEWFTGTIEAIRLRADIQNSYCCEPLNVINIKVADNSFLVATGRWIDPQMGGGLMDAMVLYVHEARHNEGYGHTCNAGADDKTIAEMGSWGVQYYLLQWLAQHADPVFFRAPVNDPDVYRRITLDQMLSIRRSRFCNEPALTPGATPTLAG